MVAMKENKRDDIIIVHEDCWLSFRHFLLNQWDKSNELDTVSFTHTHTMINEREKKKIHAFKPLKANNFVNRLSFLKVHLILWTKIVGFAYFSFPISIVRIYLFATSLSSSMFYSECNEITTMH